MIDVVFFIVFVILSIIVFIILFMAVAVGGVFVGLYSLKQVKKEECAIIALLLFIVPLTVILCVTQENIAEEQTIQCK